MESTVKEIKSPLREYLLSRQNIFIEHSNVQDISSINEGSCKIGIELYNYEECINDCLDFNYNPDEDYWFIEYLDKKTGNYEVEYKHDIFLNLIYFLVKKYNVCLTILDDYNNTEYKLLIQNENIVRKDIENDKEEFLALTEEQKEKFHKDLTYCINLCRLTAGTNPLPISVIGSSNEFDDFFNH